MRNISGFTDRFAAVWNQPQFHSPAQWNSAFQCNDWLSMRKLQKSERKTTSKRGKTSSGLSAIASQSMRV